ncbi:hypothetical protein D915_006093 [Fasciola hepatica]|uniref:PH domain-containing protein n=1 Tax=Fasciola hepatica TaxID=6192 RepID=A0A4E0R885_FASHE|nr:hypothetical protein D915_006093 [Fasciola hepatica]
MSGLVKQGWVKKWSGSKNKWTDVYCKLLQSGWFQWFENESSTSPKRSIDIRKVTAYLAFGDVISKVPCKPAALSINEIPQSFGVPHEPHNGTRMSFFVCPNVWEMNNWMNAMISVIQGGGYQQPSTYQPPAPSGSIGFGMPDPAQFGGASVGMMPGMGAPPPYTPSVPQNYGPPAGYCPPAPAPTMPAGSYNPAVGPGCNYPRQPGPPAYGTQPLAGQQFVTQGGQPYEVVYVKGKPKKKKLGGLKNAAVGLASGMAGGYLASRLFGGFGGGWGGPCHVGGLGRWGSWSSLSSLSWSD